ncbi:MucR family transcriptional regulator [Methylobacterium radiotolerans]|nr:MucR family transcriptional regulator [Methylobacterium radiotolerans]
MTPEDSDQPFDAVKLAGEIVAAYISNNSLPVNELPTLLRAVHETIANLGSGAAPAAAEQAPEVTKVTPAQIRKSVQAEGIVSFIDGKTYKTLKRHLTSKGLTPESYRERFGLPRDYPMVAPSYAEMRSALARSIGLGQVGGQSKRAGRGSKAA